MNRSHQGFVRRSLLAPATVQVRFGACARYAQAVALERGDCAPRPRERADARREPLGVALGLVAKALGIESRGGAVALLGLGETLVQAVDDQLGKRGGGNRGRGSDEARILLP